MFEPSQIGTVRLGFDILQHHRSWLVDPPQNGKTHGAQIKPWRRNWVFGLVGSCSHWSRNDQHKDLGPTRMFSVGLPRNRGCHQIHQTAISIRNMPINYKILGPFAAGCMLQPSEPGVVQCRVHGTNRQGRYEKCCVANLNRYTVRTRALKGLPHGMCPNPSRLWVQDHQQVQEILVPPPMACCGLAHISLRIYNYLIYPYFVNFW